MTNQKKVETIQKNTIIKKKKSEGLEHKTSLNKRKVRLHSHLKVNIPIFQSLMMILPSLAKHAAAEDTGKYSDVTGLEMTNKVTEKNAAPDHVIVDLPADNNPQARSSKNLGHSTLNSSHVAQSSNANLVPSHHLSTLSHPQVHYIPSISIPTFSSGSTGQPTHFQTPPTPALPVTFVPEIIKGTYGELHVDVNGKYTFVLNSNSPQYISLSQQQQGTDHFVLHLSNGSSIIVQVPVMGKQDTPSISGDLAGVVTEDHNVDSQGLLHANGKIDVVDPDQNQSSVTPEVITGKYGSLTIDADGHWQYQVDNSISNVQALTGATSLHESFTIHTKDGTPQTIDMTIGGNDDSATITGVDAGAVTEESQLQTSGTLTVTDVDTGEAHFSNTNIIGTLGTLHLTDNGSWTYDLDNSNPTVQALGQGQQVKDIISVQSADGTPHQIAIVVNGRNDAAVITGTTTGAVTEDRINGMQWLLTGGKMHVSDSDSGEAKFDPVIHAHNYAGIGYTSALGAEVIVTPDGDWHYQLDNNITQVQSLGQGQSYIDKVTVHTVDGTMQELEVTITGTNDAPTVTGSRVLPEGTEDQTLHITQTQLIAGASDIDKNDAGTLYVDAVTADHGTVTNNPDGSFTFHPDKDYNGQVHFTYNVKDAHGGVTATGANLHLQATGDAAHFLGTDTGSLTEDKHVQGDAQHTIFTTGVLDITDPDAGEDHFRATRNAHALHDPYGGTLTIGKSGDWSYSVPNGNVQHLGQGQSEQVQYEVQSAGGDKHFITLTVHGTNDAPTVSANVQLNSGREDTTQIITSAELLANATDVDTNDLGLLSISNLTVNHGSILDNGDGTFTLVPEKDYNGQLQFQYQVHDHHGGVTPAAASMSVVAVNDRPDVQPLLDSVKEDSTSHHLVDLLTGATDKEGDSLSASQISYSVDGSTATTSLPDGFILGPDGHSLVIDATHSAFQHLSVGQTQQVVVNYIVDDGHGGQASQSATLTIEGADDKAVLTSNIIQMTESQALASKTSVYHGNLQLTDPDTGDHTQFVFSGRYMGNDYAPGSLYIWPDGSYEFRLESATNRHSDDLIDSLHKGESLEFPYQVRTSDGQRFNIIVKVTGEDDQAKIVVGKYSSLDNHAYEDNLSPGSTPNQVWSGGNLHVVDPDHGQAGFVAQRFNTPEGGHFSINVRGGWQYTIDNAKLQHLGEGQSYQKTFTVESIDGTAHQDITVTVHGTNDAPVVTSSITLSQGTEDTPIVLRMADLLAHASDVDDNSQLRVANLVVDHGSVVDNHDGTHTFTPTKDYNGQVHFTYDVQDAHGGLTHTGATTTLAAVDDKTIISGVDHGVATEDIGTHMSTHVNLMDAVDWQALQITDADSPNTQVTIEFAGKQYTWDLGSDLDVTTPYGKFQFHTIASGPHQGEHSWSYIGDNNNVHVQELKQGESLIESIKLIATDGTEFPITVKVNGTEDGVVIDSKSELGHVVENAQTGASVSGNVVAHDVDLHDTVSWTQTPTGGVSGQYGTFHLSADGQWHYDVDQSKATKLGDGDEYWEHFTVEAVSTDGSHVSKSVSVVVHGNNDAPTVLRGEVTLPSGNEDTSIHITQAQLVANAIDVDANDRGWLHVENLTTNHGRLTPNSDGSFTFTPDPNYNGMVHFTYDVADRHGGIAHTGANTTLAAVNDAAVFSGVDTGSVTEDHNVHPSVQGNYSYKLETSGTLTATDTDAGESGFDFKTLMTASAHPEWAPYQSKLRGQLEIDQDGNWNYYIDNRKPEVQSLGAGETLTDTVTIQSKDGTPHVITVTIQGTNDAPILGVNQTSSTTGTFTETDVDVTDSHTFSVVSSAGQFGSLSVGPNTGDYVYTPNTSITGMSYNSATNTYHGVDVFEVKVSDGHTENSKFITFDASGHITMSPTGGLVISTTVPQQPTVTTTLPTLLMVTNVASTNSVTLDLAPTSDSGSSNTDNLTNDTTPTITGHTDIPYSQVTVYDGSTPVGHALSDASGQYSVAVSSLSDGDHNLTAKALAPSSVMPATSSLLSVHIDTQVHVGIQADPVTADNVINAQESNNSIDITGSVSGDFNAGDIVTLYVNGTQHTGVVDAKGHYSIAVPGSELIADTDQKIEASIAVTDSAGNSAHATAGVTYQVDTQVSVPTITFENVGADNLYNKAEIARGHANTITATVTPPGDAKIGEHLVVNGQDHVLDAHSLQHGIQIEVHPGSNVQATMTDEHGNTAGSQGFAASAIPEPIVVRPPSGSHQVSGTLGVPPLLPSLTPVPSTQSGWRIHLPNGQYVTSHHGQYGTLTIDPQTGHLHYQEQAQVHTGPHGSASGIGQHEDKFEVALQGTNQDEVVAHVSVQILSHGPGHSGKLTIGTEVVDMTITPVVHASHPPPPPVQHDEPDMASQADFTVTLSDDSNLGLTQQTHQTNHHGAAAYLDALGIKPDATSTTAHDQPADMDIVLAQVDQQDAATHDQTHLDMSDALEHHDANINHNQDDEHHHHNDLDGLPDIDPNS